MRSRCSLAGIFLLLSVFLLFSSCRRKTEGSIDFGLPGEEPLDYLPGVEWAVITDPVAAFREDAGFENKVLQHARRGDVLMVTGKKISSIKDSDGTVRVVTWYGFDRGWLVEDSLSVYGNRMNARAAASRLLER